MTHDAWTHYEVQVRRVTQKAVLAYLVDAEREQWFPLSVLDNLPSDFLDAEGSDDVVDLYAADWFVDRMESEIDDERA